MLGKKNVEFKLGNGVRPADMIGKALKSECLVKVFASEAIEAGAELLSTYGPDYWSDARNPTK